MELLRRERERRGLTLDEVAERTCIPRRYLAALEEDDQEVLPPGPFLKGYRRQYLAFLNLPEPAQDESAGVEPAPLPKDAPLSEDETTERIREDPVPLVRLAVAGFAVTLTIVLALKIVSLVMDRPAESTASAGLSPPRVAPVAAERIEVRALEDTRLRVVTDGRIAFDDVLSAGKTLTFSANDRLEVDPADLRTVVVHYNGERIDPLGNVSHPRRLVFIHDAPN